MKEQYIHINQLGTKRYYSDREMNILHREDGPAIEYADGDKAWYIDDKLHREDGPAVETANGHKAWYINGKCHREDGPAIEDADGDKEWWLDGKRHREDGHAVESANGSKEWYINGKLHREDGPAIEYADGSKEWRINGKCHREDGPAIDDADGYKEWYLNGKQLTEAEFNELNSSDLFSSPLNHLVVLHRVLYGTIEPELALAYLHQHLRDDADLADMGRPLKYQYQENAKRIR